MTSVVMIHVSIFWTTCGVYTCLVTQLNAICLSFLLFLYNGFFSHLLLTVILPFPFNLSGVCIVLLYFFVILTIPILYISPFSLSFLFLPFLHLIPLPCLSMPLLSSWPEGPSLPLWLFLTVECARLQIFVMLIGHSFSGYTGRHHSYI